DIPQINSLCTVFGESEVISLLSQGRRVEDIIAGIHKSIAKRVGSMVKKIGVKEAIFFDGGPAFNRGLKKALEQELGVDLHIPPDPQITTALGAAIIAHEHLTRTVKILRE
ncbi:MAG TPA: BadF/BadG/BcrA/BcrD ATPase family protein, partial [Candidatus Wunengus sp. YC64]